MFKDAIENKRGAIDCFLRQMKIEIIGQNLMRIFGELEYIEAWECGYLGELIKSELIKKYIENVDEKMLDLFSTEGNAICDCSRLRKKILERFAPSFFELGIREFAIRKPRVFATGCPLYSWKYFANLCRNLSISEKEFCGVAAITYPNDSNCPLCVYNDYSQHQKKDFLLVNGISVIKEICKTEMISLNKCCLRCLDCLNDCEFLLSCERRKEKQSSFELFSNWYREKKRSEKKKTCYQNCFIKDSTVWNFIIIRHMMADKNLHEVIMYEIEQAGGFFDCQLRKVRMKETVNELYFGLESAYLWDYFDHWSKPIEMNALLKSFKQQWGSFRFGNGDQKAASQCKCTLIWNKFSENKVEREEYNDLEIKMIDMARYSMTEEILGCPMGYSQGIELNKDVLDELKNTVGFEPTGQETESLLVGNEQVNCLIEKITSNIFPFAHLHCQNEEKQLFDNKAHQPYNGSCEHTICSQCIDKTPDGDCPVCGKERSFEGHQLNKDLLQEMETIKENAWEMFKEFWNSEAADSGACSKCNKNSPDLYAFLDDDRIIVYERSVHLIWEPFKSRMKTTADVLQLSRRILCQECASTQTHATEKLTSIPFWKHHLKKTNGIFLLELLDDDIGGGENCGFLQIELRKNRSTLLKVMEELLYKKKQECGYDRELIQLKLIKKLIENIDQNMKRLLILDGTPCEPVKEKTCPLCVMINLLDCAKNRSDRNRNDWMNVFEHFWSNQSPRFEKCCIRCLIYLSDRYSASCQTDTEVVNIRKMGNAISEGIKEGQLKNFQLVLTIMHCKDCNSPVDDKEIWRNLIIREYFFCVLQIITEGLSKTTFTCHARKIRIHNLAYHFLSEVCDVWLMNNQYWTDCWKFFKTSRMFKNLKLQFKKLKDEMDKEEIGVKCECTEISERTQNMMKKIGHEDCEEKRKYQELMDSIEEMARFSIAEDLEGCPMGYNHDIVLNKDLVRKLEKATDLDEEIITNKCLCVQIDSIGPNTIISGANLYQIVPLFINWWKVEASYPHLLCHECFYRLELIQNELGTLVGFHNCELRKMRMLKTFEKLIMFIQDFQINKGRVFEEDMEEMWKVFNNFISQWNLFQFGSESDQHILLPGAVCHCTKTLRKSLLLRNTNISWEVREECEYLMGASDMLAELNLTEIMLGCPLDFDHDIEDVDYFKSTTFEQPF